ncbi:RTA1 like protein-domain-containing protein [Mucidula mucida]|nr:RTA1 like protein-domain-containing protein [Mucidula mucida]
MHMLRTQRFRVRKRSRALNLKELIFLFKAPCHCRFYQYTPVRVVAAAYAGVFGLSSIIHAKQIFATKTWYFLAMMIGGIMEDIFPQPELMPYIIQSLLILLAPSLYAASIYVILGRLIQYLGTGKLSIIPVRHLTKFFVCGDVLSFLVQMGGGGISAKGNLGQKVILVGLAMQILGVRGRLSSFPHPHAARSYGRGEGTLDAIDGGALRRQHTHIDTFCFPDGRVRRRPRRQTDEKRSVVVRLWTPHSCVASCSCSTYSILQST